MALGTAIAIGTAITSAVSSISRSRRQRQLAEERARLKRLQILEIQRRNESEIALLRERATGAVGEAVARYAGSGVDVGSAATTQARMASFENLGRTILNKNFEAKFRMNQLGVEERWEIRQGQALENAGIIDSIGTLFNTGMNLYKTGGNMSGSSGSGLSNLQSGDSIMDAGFDPSSMGGAV